MDNKTNLFENGRIMAATRSDEDFLRAVAGVPEVIFDLDPDLMNISAKVKRAHEAGKKYLLHIDLAKGLGKDESGIRFLKRISVDGIISTKVGVIKLAREQGILSVQRFFIVDSQSVNTTLEGIKASKPDMIEIMPGIATKAITRLSRHVSVPIIAGGLLDEKKEIFAALGAGAAAVSTGAAELWQL